MKRFGMLFFRNTTMLAMVVLVLSLVMPYHQSVMAATSLSDDFNTCSLASSFWMFDNPANIVGATPVIEGAYTGDSVLKVTVPPNVSYTFSDSNTDAPVLWHSLSDGNLDYEVKFKAPMNEATDSWKIMGVLVRDNTQPAAPKYFRFDYNSRNGRLNQYVAYLDKAANKLTHIVDPTAGPKDLPGANLVNGDLYIRIQYVKATSTWTVTYRGVTGNGTVVFDNVTDSFVGTAYNPGFTVTDIGLFVGSTGVNAPGHTMVVDYFRNMADPNFTVANDDDMVLTVQKAGTGTGEVTQTCGTGNQVNLTANATTGSVFAGWSGAVTSSNQTIAVTMDASKTVIATFNTGTELPPVLWMPFITN